MIPGMLRPGSPPGEHRVFEALRDHPATGDWVVFHGLRIRHHASQVEGEADFVVLVPGEGMLVVEVKSHDRIVAGDDGLWRLGSQEPTTRSPYDQVWENSRSIRMWIERKAYVPVYPIWQAVWFPMVGGEVKQRLEQRIDVPEQSTLTRADLDPSRLVQSIIGSLRHGRSELDRRQVRFIDGRPDAQDVDEARGLLMPPADWGYEMADVRARRQKSLQAATERQEEALRYFTTYEQLIVEGPAGTGKTNVAMRAAQQAANRDETVLLTCFNRRLEADLRHRLRDRGDITVERVHRLMLALSGLTPPEDADDAWWNGTLPAATLAVTRAPGFTPPYSCLVADEAQDLARETTLDVLDSLLVGGLAGARVVLAGDFARQDIYRPSTPLAAPPPPVAPLVEEAAAAGRSRLETITQRMTTPGTMTLANNVRQSPDLAELIELMLHTEFYISFDRDFDEEEPDEPPLRIHRYRDETEQQALLEQSLIALWNDGWDPHEILILSPRRASAASRAQGAVADALAHRDGDANGSPWGTVHAYKGLESPVFVLTDVDGRTPGWEDLLIHRRHPRHRAPGRAHGPRRDRRAGACALTAERSASSKEAMRMRVVGLLT
ncbi:hypothetical protein ABA31_27130 [Agrococcus baldri]|uniref:DNA helicase n=2 Tax=Agrococcus baldri TaxID=153730 RepID=A0AA87UYL0_9MICO|nr:hypothetical protein ABA31_27130 [Agrococcus baldri]